jgi:ribosomal protein L37AE/L43A
MGFATDSMARNAVPFQKGLSEPEFERRYGTEEPCREAVIAARWPQGFQCPGCGSQRHSMVTTRDLFQCSDCRLQTSPIGGTIFASAKLPPRTWSRALYHMTQSKQGISGIEPGCRLGVTQTTACKIKHKLAQVMLERDASRQLSGRVEIDDASAGGERTGGKRGRGAQGNTPFAAAVETTGDGKPVRIKLRRVTSFCTHSIASFAKTSLAPDCTVVCAASLASPRPDVRIKSPSHAADPSRRAHPPSSGPIRRSATSRRRSPAPIGPLVPGTYRAPSPSSSTASIGDTISPP